MNENWLLEKYILEYHGWEVGIAYSVGIVGTIGFFATYKLKPFRNCVKYSVNRVLVNPGRIWIQK